MTLPRERLWLPRWYVPLFCALQMNPNVSTASRGPTRSFDDIAADFILRDGASMAAPLRAETLRMFLDSLALRERLAGSVPSSNFDPTLHAQMKKLPSRIGADMPTAQDAAMRVSFPSTEPLPLARSATLEVAVNQTRLLRYGGWEAAALALQRAANACRELSPNPEVEVWEAAPDGHVTVTVRSYFACDDGDFLMMTDRHRLSLSDAGWQVDGTQRSIHTPCAVWSPAQQQQWLEQAGLVDP